MELAITTRNLQLSSTTRDYLQRKFQPIQRQLREYNGPAEAKLEARREQTRSAQHQVVVQITLNLGGTLLRAEERAPTVNAAADAATEVMEHQIRRFKGRRFTNLRAQGGSATESIRTSDAPALVAEDGEDEAVATPSGHVVRVKRFPMKPITVEEAAVQMELLGHEFFLFMNSETGQHNVIYRRKDGDYTLIEPVQM
ncbi:MAG: ribosome-associated translation inhibitor RaiA [Chloroflexi bacterium]|nr:ribosome-associated translation inhibitor RaiA [Chloroflexota bacterium]